MKDKYYIFLIIGLLWLGFAGYYLSQQGQDGFYACLVIGNVWFAAGYVYKYKDQ